MTSIDRAVDSRFISDTFSVQLAVGLGMIALCVIIHGVGLFTLRRLMHGERTEEQLERMEPL
jgi:hypothetical protein